MRLEPGTLVDGYRVERMLGSGATGEVWSALDRHGDRVALKMLSPRWAQAPSNRRRWLREAEAGMRVDHGNVVRTLGVGEPSDPRFGPYVVMEYVEGRSLREIKQDLGRLSEGLCLEIAAGVARALAALHHADVLHLDLKPENVLLSHDHRVKVADLGAAALRDDVLRSSHAEGFRGTGAYAAPEQLAGDARRTDGRADLFSLGVLLREMVGEQPRSDAPKGAEEPAVSRFFAAVLDRLLAPRPEDRFPSAGDLGIVLAHRTRSAWWRARESARPATRHRRRTGAASPLRGRTDALDTLLAAFDAAASGEPRAVLLAGPAGIGKTRLVDELCERAAARVDPLNVLVGAYAAGAGADTLDAYADALRAHAGERDIPLDRASRLTVAFNAWLRGRAIPRSAFELTPQGVRSALADAVRSVGTGAPTVLVIEDLQFAGSDAYALFRSIAEDLDGTRVLLVGTSREEVPDHVGAACERLDLGALGDDVVRQVLLDLLGAERVVEQVAEAVHRLAEGVPFLLIEAVNEMRERGILRARPDGRHELSGDLGSVDVGSAGADLIEARVRRLPPADREILEVGACLGRTFDPTVVASVLGEPVLGVRRALARLEAGRSLVEATGSSSRFVHQSIHAAVRSGIAPPLAREYEAVIAECARARLESAPGLSDREQGDLAVQVCESGLRSTEPTLASVHLQRALAHLMATSALARCAALVEAAATRSDLLDTDQVLATLSVGIECQAELSPSHGLRDVATRMATAAQEARDLRSECRAWTAVACAQVNLGEFEEGQTAVARAVELARSVPPGPHTLDALLRAAKMSQARGQYDASDAFLDEVLQACGDDRFTERRLFAGVMRGMNQWGRFELTDAASVLEGVRAEAEARGALTVLEDALLSLAMVRRMQGRMEEALAHSRAGVALTESVGRRTSHYTHLRVLGDTLVHAKRYAEVSAIMQRVLVEYERTSNRREIAIVRATLGAVALRNGNLAGARTVLRRAIDESRAAGVDTSEFEACEALANTLALLGDFDGARAALEDARRVGAPIAATPAFTWLHKTEGDLARLAGDRAAARREYEVGLSSMRGERPPDCDLYFVVELADLDARQGREAQAREAFARAADDASSELALLARCLAGRLAGGDAAATLEELRSRPEELAVHDRVRALTALWHGTRDPRCLEDACAGVRELSDRAPFEERSTMLERVTLYTEPLTERATARRADEDAPDP